jgi:hypothetical protein
MITIMITTMTPTTTMTIATPVTTILNTAPTGGTWSN